MEHRTSALALCTWFVGCLASSVLTFAADDFRIGGPLPQVVVDAWQQRRDACRSVHWKLKARELITQGLLNHSQEDLDEFGPRPKQDEWREREFETWIDFPTLRVRSEHRGMIHRSEDDGSTHLVPIHEAKLFDGARLQSFDLPLRGLMEHDPQGQVQGLVFEASLQPCFWGVGIVFGPDVPYSVRELNHRLDPQKFRITAVQREGELTHVSVRANLDPQKPGNHLELKIAVERDGAIVGKSLTSSGRLHSEATIEWSPTDLGWQPVSWKESSYRLDNTLAIAGDYEVLERSCAPDLNEVVFHVTPPTGTTYLDVKQRASFVKAPEGQPDVPKELYDIQQAARQRRWKWLLSAVIVLACLGGGVWWWRGRSAAE